MFKDLEQKELVLKQDVVTRWNSTCDMMERMVECEEVLRKVLDDKGWAETVSKKGNVDKKRITDKDWKVTKSVVNVLESFKSATVQLSSASACISESIPIISMIFETLDSSSDTEIGVKDLKKRLKDNLKERTEHMEDEDDFRIATLLDQRYKNGFFRDADKKAKAEERLKQLLEIEVMRLPVPDAAEVAAMPSSSSESNNNTLAAMFARRKMSVNNNPRRETSASIDKVLQDYFEAKLENNNLASWRKYEEAGKDVRAKVALCRLAKKFLTPPPTSTNTERLFSTAGNIVDGRASLSPENLERLLFLRENMIMQNISLDW